MNKTAQPAQVDVHAVLESIDAPAILLSRQYEVLAGNRRYLDRFGRPDEGERCYRISHGYDRPCDQMGESCPLAGCLQTRSRERVLHVHNSPEGRAHVDVEMLPLPDADGELNHFIEILRPVHFASAQGSARRMVGRSPAFNRMVEMITLVAARDTTVLLQGESGTGKELAAAAIHGASARSAAAMITVECAGLTDTLFESELFGHVKGAFTGAIQNKPGLLAEADGGTLFLDEIGDVPLSMQVKLLRLLETGTYRAVGSTDLRRADFRLICATHKNLKTLIQTGEFREDLFHRINAFPITLPPLRERAGDVALLAESLLATLSPDAPQALTASAVALLNTLPFPGNIRELKNVLERAVIFAHDASIDASIIHRAVGDADTPAITAEGEDWPDLDTLEHRYLQRLLAHCDGDKTRAADIAGVSLRSLYRKLASRPDTAHR
ncbi:MAG: Fis family transcriptional regulator [Salinisphaeraceae bacterium]|nr:Fis family transcriptional regulator [Salinisphaeraceae bacterium]